MIYSNNEFRMKTPLLHIMSRRGDYLEYASKYFRNDKDVVLKAVRQDGRSLKYASKELRADRSVVLEAVKQNEGAFSYASKELKNDKELAMLAVKKWSWIFIEVGEDLQHDKELLLTALKTLKIINYSRNDFLHYVRRDIKKMVRATGISDFEMALKFLIAEDEKKVIESALQTTKKTINREWL